MKRYCTKFAFISTDIENIQGYQEKVNANYVIEYHKNDESAILEMVLSADVVIFGSIPKELIEQRMSLNKLSFIYSERFYRKGVWRRWNPKTYKKLHDRIVKYRDLNLFILCASAFLPYDLKLIGFPTKKCYKWGYFPEIQKYNEEYLFKKKKGNFKKANLLWVGRLLELKHPEIVMYLAEKLIDLGYDFDFTIVGDGPMRIVLTNEIEKKNLTKYVHLVGSKNKEEVREYMERSSIFIFSSDRMEGWGAVLNEAMGCGCTPVCSHIIGSVPFLVKDGENGFIYPYWKKNIIVSKVRYLLDNPEECLEMGKRAYNDMIKLWNADVAAKRIVKLSSSLLNSEEIKFDDGPCSDAYMLKENWFKKYGSFRIV